MKKVDVLFLYETKVRELENICLLKFELERRGLTVGILNTWNQLGQTKKPYQAKLVISHAMYHDGIFDFVEGQTGKINKLINMQCEQIGTIGDEQSGNSRFILRGIAGKCVHIAWGQRTVDRLIEKSRIPATHIKLTGQIGLDFCRPEFLPYYESREELLDAYEIPQNKEVNLFISSFAYVNLPEQIQKESEIGDKAEFIRFSRESFAGILDWFTRLLASDSNQAVVYRPHPAEAGSQVLEELSSKYPGQFFVISEKSVKQWILASDRVYTWYSTAAAECFFAEKPCMILRPVCIPPMMEVSIFEKASFLTSYEEFFHSLSSTGKTSLSPDVLRQYYYVDPEEPVYKKIADCIAQVLTDDRYLIRREAPKSKPGLKSRMYQSAVKTAEKLRIKSPLIVEDVYTLERQKANYASAEEIEAITARLKSLLLSKP